MAYGDQSSVHTYKVEINPCDNTFTGNDGSSRWAENEQITSGSINGKDITFHAIYPDGYSWDDRFRWPRQPSHRECVVSGTERSSPLTGLSRPVCGHGAACRGIEASRPFTPVLSWESKARPLESDRAVVTAALLVSLRVLRSAFVKPVPRPADDV